MSVYLTLAKYKALTTLPDSAVDDVEVRYPGWVANQLESQARWIDARLRKRYSAPFGAHDADPVTPPTVQDWLTRIVNLKVLFKRGVNPSDAQFEEMRTDRDEAKAEILEAANSEEGWFDIPLRPTVDSTAITHTATRVYSEASPYVNQDIQFDRATEEDFNGGGTFG